MAKAKAKAKSKEEKKIGAKKIVLKRAPSKLEKALVPDTSCREGDKLGRKLQSRTSDECTDAA